MSLDQRSKDAGNADELPNLPERPLADASQVKGGASVTPPPTSQPAPVAVQPGVFKKINPCW
jgi:hypothetical protein